MGRPMPIMPGGQSSPVPAPDPTLALYNWQSGGWDIVSDGKQDVRIEQADPYVSAEGEIRIQMTSSPFGGARGPAGYSTMPELTVEWSIRA